MPYKNPEQRREFDRERRRQERAGAVAGVDKFFSVPFTPLTPCPTVTDLTGVVAEEINRVRAAQVETLARARTVGYLANVLIRAIEVTELERRLEELESLVKSRVNQSPDLALTETDS